MEKQTQKRTALEQRDGIQETLEGYRRFDYDYIPFGDWVMPDETYPFKPKFPDNCITAFLRFVMLTAGTVAIKLVYGARVTGKKNLRALKGKGALCVCNHFSFLDTLFVRQAVGHFRSWHTMSYYNNKTGVGGWFMRRAGMLPFSKNLKAVKCLHAEMERLLKKGKIINFYAERAMWINYQKPRPMLSGTFSYAVRFGVPVLPVFCTFQKNKKGHMKKLRINILPPVYADESLPRGERMEKMRRDAEESWKKCYESAYGIPMTYLPDRRKNKRT